MEFNILSYDEIITRIGYFRNQKGISAYKLGIEIGHTKSYIYKVESGDIKLNIETLLEILEVLEVSTEEFFYNDLENYNKDKKALNVTRNLTDEEIESLKIILKQK